MISELKTHILVISAYSILSIIFTYPVAFSVNRIPGGGDAFWVLWDFWWVNKTLPNFMDLYYTNYIYYPINVFIALVPIDSIISVPLQSILGLINTYIVMWIATFILSGYTSFLLVRHLTGDLRAAFISGLIFMFCPFHFIRAGGHFVLMSTQWIPLVVLFLYKTINESTKLNALLLALFLFLASATFSYYVIFIIAIVSIYISYQYMVLNNKLGKATVERIGIAFILYCLSIILYYYPLMEEIFVKKTGYLYHGGFVECSADLVGFFVPTILHPLFKNIVYPIYFNFSGYIIEQTVFIGYMVLILSCISILKSNTADTKFWLISSIIFFILALGPFLQINGVYSITLVNHIFYLPLPYALLMHLPVFSLIRAPGRWDIMLMLSLSVLSGYGCKYIFSTFNDDVSSKRIRKKNLLFILISLIVLFEYLSVPYPMSDATVSTFYERISKDDGDYAILEVPNMPETMIAYPEYMYYQTIHNKRLVNGYVPRPTENVEEFMGSMPFIRQLMSFSTNDDIIAQNFTEIGSSILNYYNIKYIIIHEDRMTQMQRDFASNILKRSNVGLPVIYKNDSLVVYKISKNTIKPFNALDYGWYGLENWTGAPTRWMKGNASILAFSDRNRSANLSLQATAFSRERRLEIYSKNILEVCVDVPNTSFINISIPISLKKGSNTIQLYSPQGCERPRDAIGREIEGARCLCLAIRNISIT